MITNFIYGKSIARTLKRLIIEHREFYWAIAWGGDNVTVSELMKHSTKIQKFVIGTHFYQTDPEILKKLSKVRNVRVMSPSGGGAGVFHPKLYLFMSGNRAAAVIGSANFTRGAFTVNVEACALFEGKPHEEMFLSVKAFIESKCWPAAQQITPDFLRTYRIQHNATRRERQTLEKFVELKRPTHSANANDPLEMNWAAFARKVCAGDKLRSVESRLEVLASARTLFEKAEYQRFGNN